MPGDPVDAYSNGKQGYTPEQKQQRFVRNWDLINFKPEQCNLLEIFKQRRTGEYLPVQTQFLEIMETTYGIFLLNLFPWVIGIGFHIRIELSYK